jgi:tetratricopeptide (TPR) repeat protein
MTRTLLAGMAVALWISTGCAGPNAQALMDAGRDNVKARKYDQAKESFQKCLELDQNMAECHLGLGSMLARDRKPEEAVIHYREFLRLTPDHSRAKEVQDLIKDYEDNAKKLQSGAQPAP